MRAEIKQALAQLRARNPSFELQTLQPGVRPRGKLRRVLVANRGEIAKRFCLALMEEGIESVAVVADADRQQTWHEFAGEVISIGEAANYASVPVIAAAAVLSGSDGLFPGYGFLSEVPALAEQLRDLESWCGLRCQFMGPAPEVMHAVSNKLAARALARAHGVPLFEGSALLSSVEEARHAADAVGYPVMVKLDAGGGGKGMLPVFEAEQLADAIASATRIGARTYGNADFYIEKLIQNPIHIEVQIFNGTAVGIRKCAVQRRNQKIVEESGESFLDDKTKLKLLAAAESMAYASGYANGCGAGTVEFLMDGSSGDIGFLEINTRLQVEYPVTDQSLGIDLVAWQILQFDGRTDEIPFQQALSQRFARRQHAIQCRVYAEDPWNDWAPAPGRVLAIDLPTFNGVRCDFGFRAGDDILPDYDPMIGKLIAFGADREEALLRMQRALRELHVRGITTNVDQLRRIVAHPAFRDGNYTNRLLADHPELCTAEEDIIHTARGAVLGVLASTLFDLHDAVEQCFAAGDLEALLHGELLHKIAGAYDVEIGTACFRVRVIQSELYEYQCYLDEIHIGSVLVRKCDAQRGEVRLIQGKRGFSVRLDRRPGTTHIHLREANGHIRYFRARLRPLGVGASGDRPGTLRAPFQGSFVRFATDNDGAPLRPGTRLRKGDPLLVISAMKMETTLTAPADGRIEFLVEDGELERLVQGRTPSGLVIGRKINEGELLAVVSDGESTPVGAPLDPSHHLAARSLLVGAPEEHWSSLWEDSAQSSTSPISATMLAHIRAQFLGYICDDESSARLTTALANAPESIPDDVEEELGRVFGVVASLQQVYSPALGKDQTWFGEMNRLLQEWNNETYQPPLYFRTVMANILEQHGLRGDTGWRDDPDKRLAFFFVMRSYQRIAKNEELIGRLIGQALQLSDLKGPTKRSLKRFLDGNTRSADEGEGRLMRQLQRRLETQPKKLPIDSYQRRTRANPGSHVLINDRIAEALRDFAAKWEDGERPANKPNENITDRPPAHSRQSLANHPELSALFNELSHRHQILWLPSSQAEVVVLGLLPRHSANGTGPNQPPATALPLAAAPARQQEAAQHRDDNRHAALYFVGLLPSGHLRMPPAGDSHASGFPELAQLAAQLAAGIREYRSNGWSGPTHLHILAAGRASLLDLTGSEPGFITYHPLRRGIGRSLRSFVGLNVGTALIEVREQRPGRVSPKRKRFSIRAHGNNVAIGIADESDARHPLWNTTTDRALQTLLNRDKWPVERWAEECFDSGSLSEIRIPSIDDEGGPVGARIYRGTIGKFPAFFFMKDSRLRGGATGDREGRKYAAAILISYFEDAPLYVWNDGAGANIREGMIALNRAAEGFFLNAATAAKKSYASLLRLLEAHPDRALEKLYRELREMLGWTQHSDGPQKFVLVAVGIGSSTGLDVYGSSQAHLQVMLDAPESYRVLTGSAVIKSVTGEDLTNYEIGGAGVMGQLTGTVDFVARDKFELLARLHRLHTFLQRRHTGNIFAHRPAPFKKRPPFVILDESMLEGAQFLPCKQEYREGSALLGGLLATSEGTMLVMGPRTETGIRAAACTIKARELARLAGRLGLPQILVFGNDWFRERAPRSAHAIAGRADLMRTLSSTKTPRIHIICRPAGLARALFNADADLLIYVPTQKESAADLQFARQTAGLVCNSVQEALELAADFAGRLQPNGKQLAAGDGQVNGFNVPRPGARNSESHEPPGKAGDGPDSSARIELPGLKSQPFDVKTEVLAKMFDTGSVLILNQSGDGPQHEPNLVTALAKLDGRDVAVLADQPLYGGAPDAPGTEKFRRFVEFANRWRLPVIMISNAAGFLPGTRQEQLRIQQIGGESLDVNVLSDVPVVSITLKQNYGGRQIHAFSRLLRPGIVGLALADSQMAVMGSSASFDLFQGKRYQELLAQGQTGAAEELRANYISEFEQKSAARADARSSGALDACVEDASDLRQKAIEALGWSSERGAVPFTSTQAGAAR